MKLIIPLFVLILLAQCTGQSNTKAVSSNSEQLDFAEIKAVLDSQAYHWNMGNIKAFMRGYWYSDSLRFISKKGVRYGYHQVESNYLKHYNTKEKMGFLKFDSLQYTLLSKEPLVNVTGTWQISGKDSIGGFFSLLFKRSNEEWRILLDHTW